uniref:Uncharacterized protein n=1 Tax=Arundo donax TaxID=35708 RepID=A0A0A9BMF5_ARUDO
MRKGYVDIMALLPRLGNSEFCTTFSNNVIFPTRGDNVGSKRLIKRMVSYYANGPSLRTRTRSPLKWMYFHFIKYFSRTNCSLSSCPRVTNALPILLVVSSSGRTPSSSMSAYI